jgi:hypothetical protein
MLTPGKWCPFEINLTTTWTAPYFDHRYLGQHQIQWFLHKNKRSYIIFCDNNHPRASAHRSCLKDNVQDYAHAVQIVVYFRTSNPIFSWHTRLKVGKKQEKNVLE